MRDVPVRIMGDIAVMRIGFVRRDAEQTDLRGFHPVHGIGDGMIECLIILDVMVARGNQHKRIVMFV